MNRLSRFARRGRHGLTVLMWALFIFAFVWSPPAQSAQGMLRWNARSFYGIANCERIDWSSSCAGQLVPEACYNQYIASCQSISGWTAHALPVDGYGHFLLNGVPVPTVQSSNWGRAYDPVLLGQAVLHEATNVFDASFDTSLLRIGSNTVRFDYGPHMKNGVVTWDRFSLISSSGTRELLSVMHSGPRAWRLLNLDPVNQNHYCLGLPQPFASYCSVFASGTETGDELDFDNLTASINLTVEEANPGFGKALEALEAAITEAEVSLIDRAKDLGDLGRQLQQLESLRTDVEGLVAKGLDQLSPEELDALFAKYPAVPGHVRDALVELVKDLKRSVQELRDELKRINAEFERQVRGVVELVDQNISSSGFNPNDPSGYAFGGGEVPTITVPALTSEFDPAHDPYKAYADAILARLGALVVGGKVTERSTFSSVVRTWDANQRALAKALLQNSVSQAEFGAFQAARQTVTDFLRRFLDDQGWFLDNPVPIHIRALFDGTYVRILGDQSLQLKDGLNLWNGSQLTTPQQVFLQSIQGLANGMIAVEGELASAGELLKRVEELSDDLSRQAARLAIGFTPFANDTLDFCEVVTGREFCVPDGRELTTEERSYSALGLGLGSGPFWNGVGQVTGALLGAVVTDIVKIVKDVKGTGSVFVRHIYGDYLKYHRGIRGAISPLPEGFEPVVFQHLTTLGRKHLLIGDVAVTSALKTFGNFKPVDFINTLTDGRLVLSEVKGVTTGGAAVSDAMLKFEQTCAALKQVAPNAQVGALEIIIPAGAKLENNYKSVGGQLIRISDGQVVRLEGLVVKVVEVPW